jgi:hypothetical protein
MRKPPPPHPRGEPRTPGSGRRRGSLNRRTVQMRELMSSLCHDVDYQHRLRSDFRRRRVHSTIEALVWGHVIGKPADRVQLAANVTLDRNLDEERELFSRLSIQQMEEIATESQALVDRVMAMVKANAQTPDDVASRRAAVVDGESSAPNPTWTGTDVTETGEVNTPLNRDRGQSRRTPTPVGVSQSPTARVATSTPTITNKGDAMCAETTPRDTP